MTISVDRIEDNVAAVEFDDRVRLEIPASELPANAREGDCYTIEDDGRLTLDVSEINRRRKRNADLFKSLMAE